MKEMKRKKCPDTVRIAQVSFYLELEPQEEAVVLEAVDISSSRPLQWVDLPANSSRVFLSGLPPDKLLNVTLKLARGADPLALEHFLSKTVFTGGCVPPTSSNFTRTLLDFFFPTKSSGGCALTLPSKACVVQDDTGSSPDLPITFICSIYLALHKSVLFFCLLGPRTSQEPMETGRRKEKN